MQAEFDNMLARESSAALPPSEGDSRHGPSGNGPIANSSAQEDVTVRFMLGLCIPPP